MALEGDSRPVGTVSLKPTSGDALPHLTPWCVALLVAPERRGRGVGSALVAAVEDAARRLGYARLYVATDTASGLVTRRGWRPVDTAGTLRGTVPVFAREL